MKLYLIRHGHAETPNSKGERPLSPQGKAEVFELAKKLQKLQVSPTKVFHSELLRAKQTAFILARALNLDPLPQESPYLRPEDSVHDWANQLEIYQEDIMLVGHMPYMSFLSEALSGVVAGFSTAEAFAFERSHNDQWKMIFRTTESLS